jgi:anoctamin-8
LPLPCYLVTYGWPVTCSLLKAAEEVHLPKTLRSEYGGGLKEFVQQEVAYFEGTDNEREFFTTQERQWLVLHLLHTLRAGPEDQVAGLKLIEGQAIGMLCQASAIKLQARIRNKILCFFLLTY